MVSSDNNGKCREKAATVSLPCSKEQATKESDGKTCILSSAYFGPVQWYQKLNRYKCVIEQHDHFVKQTYRNRCVIATANGLQSLSIPVEKFEGSKCAMKDVRISDHANWRHLHWNALLSSYGESPFFEYYQDDIRPFFEKKWDYLLDFNTAIMEKMCELLDVRPQYCFSTEFIPIADEPSECSWTDLREAIHPKKPLKDDEFVPTTYYQVYRHKYPFQPNLSILDLLFNEGNEAILYL